MFAPVPGVEEDPATASAAATLATVLATENADMNDTFNWTINQGVAMGRASRIQASAKKTDGKVTRASVGGPTIIVGEGVMTVSI
jgi:trans-2,3-dihydro-3-hydroxyanthranilate isomerase